MDLRAICSLLGFTIAESQKNIIDGFTCNLLLVNLQQPGVCTPVMDQPPVVQVIKEIAEQSIIDAVMFSKWYKNVVLKW